MRATVLEQIIPACKFILLSTVLTGFIYGVSVTAIAGLLWPERSAGSVVFVGGAPVGSRLIGQEFSTDKYFHGRPSASSYGTLPSSASNLGPTSDSLRLLVQERQRAWLLIENADSTGTIPIEMLYASGSGLDPEISPEAALAQVPHVSKARNYAPEQTVSLEKLIRDMTIGKQFHVLGQPRINVLLLNVAIDNRN
jgi:K+-transporting ATPase ATPase C chain